jgi:hypothetical protein
MQQPEDIDDSPAEQAVARVAAVDVAKASGVVSTRVPRDTGGDDSQGRFSTKVWAVSATTNAILELADHLTSMAIEMVVLETGHRLLAAVHLRTRSGRAACRAGRRCRARPAQTARTWTSLGVNQGVASAVSIEDELRMLDRSALYGVLTEIEALGLDPLEVRKLIPGPQNHQNQATAIHPDGHYPRTRPVRYEKAPLP